MSTSVPAGGAGSGDGGRPTGPGDSVSAQRYVALRNSSDFRELRASFRRFAFPMTAAFLAWYLLYVVCSAWARDFMGQQVIGVINVAFVFGLLQFLSTFLIAWLYARYAGRRLDPLADRVARDAATMRRGGGDAR
jgi:uncharacterized membrane protein (DUF485 family)